MDLSNRQGRREQGQRIQTAVERAGLSIEELANRIGCSRALIYQYLSGSTLAQPDRLQQIAALCEVPLSYFYADTIDAAEPDGARPDAGPLAAQDVTQRLGDGLRALQELADAQAGPPDYRALASTCERVLSIAAQLGDRQAQTRAQLRL
ncbi:MAG TPA: helix-turn-helix transcriptional regulator, partial [Chthonomonadaceae bacterium]|nr:helix-turn-helix transcriptional regulator [Chthonomonadaceae bacterium]